MRMSTLSIKRFGGASPSSEYLQLLEDYATAIDAGERQLAFLNSTMSFRAVMASLEESRRAIEQNDKVKRLTRLAFVFISLSFVTGVFGMNLKTLGTGQAEIWQIVVGAVVVYALVALLWTLAVLLPLRNHKSGFGGLGSLSESLIRRVLESHQRG